MIIKSHSKKHSINFSRFLHTLRMKNYLLLIYVAAAFLQACSHSTDNRNNSEDILRKGSELYLRSGCNVCHSLDGTDVYGPPLNNIYLKKIRVVRNGREIELTANRKYLKRAIVNPRHEKVFEYRNKEMPLTSLSNEEAELLVDYLIELNRFNAEDK
jgi:mono/diheme cytochrome c family protein